MSGYVFGGVSALSRVHCHIRSVFPLSGEIVFLPLLFNNNSACDQSFIVNYSVLILIGLYYQQLDEVTPNATHIEKIDGRTQRNDEGLCTIKTSEQGFGLVSGMVRQAERLD